MTDSAALARGLLQTFRSQKPLADGALAQVSDETFSAPRRAETDPTGVNAKHVAGADWKTLSIPRAGSAASQPPRQGTLTPARSPLREC